MFSIQSIVFYSPQQEKSDFQSLKDGFRWTSSSSSRPGLTGFLFGEPLRVVVFVYGNQAQQVPVGFRAKDLRAVSIAMQKSGGKDAWAAFALHAGFGFQFVECRQRNTVSAVEV